MYVHECVCLNKAINIYKSLSCFLSLSLSFSLLSFTVLCVQSLSLHFSKEPQSQDALHGRSAMLRCEVSEAAGVRYSWLQDGQPVQGSERRFIEDGSLKFTAVDRHLDTGNFQCVATSLTSGEVATSTNASFNIKCKWIRSVLHDVSKMPLLNFLPRLCLGNSCLPSYISSGDILKRFAVRDPFKNSMDPLSLRHRGTVD